jgi:hypothetical protein
LCAASADATRGENEPLSSPIMCFAFDVRVSGGSRSLSSNRSSKSPSDSLIAASRLPEVTATLWLQLESCLGLSATSR